MKIHIDSIIDAALRLLGNEQRLVEAYGMAGLLLRRVVFWEELVIQAAGGVEASRSGVPRDLLVSGRLSCRAHLLSAHADGTRT